MKPSYIVDEHHLLLVTVYAHGVESNPVPIFERFFDRPGRLLPEFDGRVVADAEKKALVCLGPHLQHPERVRSCLPNSKNDRQKRDKDKCASGRV